MTREQLEIQIKEDLQGVHHMICMAILDTLLSNAWSVNHLLSIDDLLVFLPLFCPPERLIQLLPYMTSSRTHLLDGKVYFVDENQKTEMTHDQFGTAKQGFIRHPVTNEILDYELNSERIKMFYAASDVIKNILRGQS